MAILYTFPESPLSSVPASAAVVSSAFDVLAAVVSCAVVGSAAAPPHPLKETAIKTAMVIAVIFLFIIFPPQ